MSKTMKLAILIILFLPIVTALDECLTETEPIDVPCQITTTWECIGSCNTTTVNIYDDGGNLIGHTNLTDVSIYGMYIWNRTVIGSYHFAYSNGDTGNINIIYTMELLYGVLVFGGYLLAQFILILFMHLFKEDRGTSFVYGVIASIISFIMAAILMSGFEVIRGVTFIININYYLIALTVGMGFYTVMASYAFYSDIKDGRKQEYSYRPE